MSNEKILKPGSKAPPFSLPTTPDQKVSLSDFKDRVVVLIFYPADWSPVCSKELVIFNDDLSKIKKYQAQVIGISIDSSWCHSAFSESKKFQFPLLSDSTPHGEVSRKYGVYDEKTQTSQRALFVIDKNGTIVWSYLSPVGENPGTEGVIKALESLNTKT